MIYYIDGLFIDVPIVPDYWITARLNTAFKGYACIWNTEMKETHGRSNWPWWKSQIIQKYIHDDIAKTSQEIRKRTNIGKYSPNKSSGFREKQPFRVELKGNPRESVVEVARKKNYCHNCGSTDHYANTLLKSKKKVYAIEKVPEDESLTEDSESKSMGDAIREKSDQEQNPREEFIVEYQEETPLEIQDIQLEEGILQDTANKNLFKNTPDAK
ncbi:hypothetical protein O181_041925 [Austropuccinia psidii MF-1]|uniref:Uncharacterized protein n=1 Tax=Austropuccinia psidii MF-1 TaxID=1389203 RepID=A0A9Q3HHM5_9BASI|nr:hypothetical protein [Austropuccinia psidii MF-1]